MHKCEMSEKGPEGWGGRKLQFFRFFEKRELILVLFVHLFDLCLFGFVGFLFLLGSGKGCGL